MRFLCGDGHAAARFCNLTTFAIMCGRYELHTPIRYVAEYFDAMLVDDMRDYVPHYNIAPSLRVPVIREGKQGRTAEGMTWGLLASWSKDASGVKPINARAETIFDKPTFRNAIRKRRCILPADGFYEWQPGALRKQPYRIAMADGSPLALAGIWEYWAKEGHEPVISCAVIVTAANDFMRPIHERMPVIVRREDFARWLDPASSDTDAIAQMMTPAQADVLTAHPVSTRVNNVRNDDAQLIEPQHA